MRSLGFLAVQDLLGCAGQGCLPQDSKGPVTHPGIRVQVCMQMCSHFNVQRYEAFVLKSIVRLLAYLVSVACIGFSVLA